MWQMPLGLVPVVPVAADSVAALADSEELVDFKKLGEPEVIEEFEELRVRALLMELVIFMGFPLILVLFSTF